MRYKSYLSLNRSKTFEKPNDDVYSTKCIVVLAKKTTNGFNISFRMYDIYNKSKKLSCPKVANLEKPMMTHPIQYYSYPVVSSTYLPS